MVMADKPTELCLEIDLDENDDINSDKIKKEICDRYGKYLYKFYDDIPFVIETSEDNKTIIVKLFTLWTTSKK